MKVCIIGTAPGSRLIAPYGNPDFEIWACSAGNSQASALPRVTKWYELHALCDMMAAENQVWCIPYFAWLRSQSFPIYMQEVNEYIPQAIVFPYKLLTEEFGPNPKKGLANWFTSSVAWMMAHAIIQMKEGDEIAIFGVDMAATEEHYSSQKSGCQRFIEIAKAKGIKVTVPYESCLGKTFPLYGYAEATPMGRKLQSRRFEILKHKGALDGQIRSGELQRAFFEGALEAVDYDIRTWVDGMDADLDTMGKEGGEDFVNGLKTKSEQIAQVPLTGDFQSNGRGVFVPKNLTDASSEPVVKVTEDSTGAKHYEASHEPGKFGVKGSALGPSGEAVKTEKEKRGHAKETNGGATARG